MLIEYKTTSRLPTNNFILIGQSTVTHLNFGSYLFRDNNKLQSLDVCYSCYCLILWYFGHMYPQYVTKTEKKVKWFVLYILSKTVWCDKFRIKPKILLDINKRLRKIFKNTLFAIYVMNIRTTTNTLFYVPPISYFLMYFIIYEDTEKLYVNG